ncbi:MAG: glycerol-3-phosphate acyltransferase [Ruminococcaceae bacterium]|nr:glycerol-3-phosphate acyltransferase [Oscillospiraceae bacterium]
MVYSIVIALLIAYFLGNLNGAVCMSLLKHDDVRSHGSGNAGLTNYIRNFGRASALLVVAIDMGKAVLACEAGRLIMTPYDMATEGTALGALGVLLGHIFPVLLGFKGGKGILSGVTVALMLDWRLGLLVFGIFLVAYMLTHYVSLGSVLSAGSFGPLYALVHPDAGVVPIAVGFFLSAMIVWMHRENIKRLLKGEERKTTLFGFISRNKK